MKFQMFFTFCVIILIFGCNSDPQSKSDAQKQVAVQRPDPGFSGTVHEVTLFVNTTDISPSTVNDYADFRQPYYISNEDYTTYVHSGDIVVWKGVSTTDTLDVVSIERIQHESGRFYLGKNVLHGNNGYPELVVGIIKHDTILENIGSPKEEKYKIFFKVFNKGVKKPGTFKIDPKLEIPPKN